MKNLKLFGLLSIALATTANAAVDPFEAAGLLKFVACTDEAGKEVVKLYAGSEGPAGLVVGEKGYLVNDSYDLELPLAEVVPLSEPTDEDAPVDVKFSYQQEWVLQPIRFYTEESYSAQLQQGTKTTALTCKFVGN